MKNYFLNTLAAGVLLSISQLAKAQPQLPSVEPVYVVVDKMPRFMRADSTPVALLSYLSRNTRYPVGALQDHATGRLFVSFVVNQAGGVEQAKIVKPMHPALNKEALRVVREMPRWEVAGQQAGQPVSVSFTVPITFNIRTATPVDIQTIQRQHQVAVQKQLTDLQAQLAAPVATGHDVAPVFLADPLGAAHYISRQQQYPLDARRAQQEGEVLVDFVVGSDGKVSNVRVAKSLFPSLDSEALRVVTGMPVWQPATREGQPVAMPLTGVPVTFRLK